MITEPVEPEDNVAPVAPEDQEEPVEPEVPADIVEPEQPAHLAEPENPVDPVNIVEPAVTAITTKTPPATTTKANTRP